MASGNDMIISDVEFCYSGIMISNFIQHLRECMVEYDQIVNEVKDRGIEDEMIRDSLSKLQLGMRKVLTKLQEEESAIASKYSDFVIDIDEIDRFLY